jgi:hypothetical protein
MREVPFENPSAVSNDSVKNHGGSGSGSTDKVCHSMYCSTMQFRDDQLPFRARSSNRTTKNCSRVLEVQVVVSLMKTWMLFACAQ